MSYGLPRIGLAVIAMLIAAAPVSASQNLAAQPPTTAPASAAWPTLISDLASPDLQSHDAARAALMRLSRADLPALRDRVAQLRPVLPAQSAALHEIVQEIYLAGEKYLMAFAVEGFDLANGERTTLAIEATSAAEAKSIASLKLSVEKVTLSGGFLGILMDDSQRADVGADNDGQHPLGVIVADRIPGFCAARNLINGDIVLGIVSPFTPFRSRIDLTNAIAPQPPGTMVNLLVLRRGQVIHVTLTLDPRPVLQVPVDETGTAFRAERQKKFDLYWQTTFKPLLSQQLS